LKAGAVSERTYLEEISIRNLGAIEESELVLGRGLNVLTGETGAGKTMILTALHLVLGGKSDVTLVRNGKDRLIATAQFSLGSLKPEAIEESGAEIEDGSIIISRTVTAEGKSKANLGGVAVPAVTLAELSESLIEIHGQSANSQIVKPSRQRELLDRFAGKTLDSALSRYINEFNAYAEMKARLSAMKSGALKRDSEIAELQALVKAWTSLKPTRGECAEIQDEINRLSSVGDLGDASTIALQALSEEESGALTLLNSAKRALDSVKEKDSKLAVLAEQVSEALFILDDSARDLASYTASLEADPARLDFLQSRKAEILAFLKRWSSIEEPDERLLELSQRVKTAKIEIEDLSGGDERVAELEKELAVIKKRLLDAAKALTQVRRSAATILQEKVTEEIHALSMPHTTFYMDVISPDYEGELKESHFTSFGCDEIQALIQGQSDGPKIALGKGASGGEMSRVMLAIEVVIAESAPVGTYIFDEVDAGIGGKAAIEVGKRLHALSQQAQVIVVTHLPQVAAWADTHFLVQKESDGTVVASGVRRISDSERVEEIARMLAGLESSESAREHATELLALRG
jgi:DNA repair protein RecN (Recombination protein N)